jgi:lambda family phage portal protein
MELRLLQWLNHLGFGKASRDQRELRRVAVAGHPGAGAFPGVAVRARYDSAQTTDENRRHWANADALSATAAMNPQVRRTLRNRARYEVANNGHAKGIVNTLANYVVGTGPRLQMITDDPEANRVIEREFTRWAKAVRLAHKLWTMRVSQCESGEVFGVLATNPQVDAPVKLDLRLIEADQVTTPWRFRDDAFLIDGIQYDEFGNPLAYFVLQRHPGDTSFFKAGSGEAGVEDFDVIPADGVVHLYRAERPSQTRGVPEITSSLSLFAMLRRYSLAVLSSAEQAALPSGVIYTDAPADSDAAGVEPMDQVEMDRGLWLTMPYGWKVGQIRAEQPTTMYGDYTSKVLNEIARPLNMPFNIASGNSAGYNYASGRLDHQSFFKAIRIDQSHLADIVLDRIFRAWINEAVLIEGLLPQSVRTVIAEAEGYPHQWFWDGFEHADPAKEANAQATRLKSNTTTLAAEYAKSGLDWEQELRQRAKEAALMKELGLSETSVATNSQTDDADDEEEEDSPSDERTDHRTT